MEQRGSRFPPSFDGGFFQGLRPDLGRGKHLFPWGASTLSKADTVPAEGGIVGPVARPDASPRDPHRNGWLSEDMRLRKDRTGF